MTDYTTLERLAFINGQHDLAALYDKMAMIEDIPADVLTEVAETGLDKIKETEYDRGYDNGVRDASDERLLEEIAGLKAQVKTLTDACKAMYDSYAFFLNWLNGSEAKLASNRKQAIRDQEINLLRWRRP